MTAPERQAVWRAGCIDQGLDGAVLLEGGREAPDAMRIGDVNGDGSCSADRAGKGEGQGGMHGRQPKESRRKHDYDQKDEDEYEFHDISCDINKDRSVELTYNRAVSAAFPLVLTAAPRGGRPLDCPEIGTIRGAQ